MRTDDGYIIYKCLNGEPESFGVLVDKYKEGIYAYTYTKLQDWHDAQDVTQETFIQAYRKLHTLKRWDSFAGWLYRIASNFCKNWKSSKSKRPDRDFIEDQKPAIIDKPSMDHYHESEMVESVHEALNSLSETYREVLTLYYFGGMDSNKIAEVLNTSPVAIRLRLSRARAHLREEIFNMMSVTFEQQKLKSGFTFRIVEAIKRIKIHPTSQTKGVPWGVSLATGLIFTILSFNSHFNPIVMFNSLGGSFLPSESKVLRVGEIPTDMTNIAKVTFLSSQQGNGNSSDKSPNQNALFMAPKANVGKWVRKADMPTARTQFASAVVNGKIYAFGGLKTVNGNFVYLSTLEEYDPILDKWTKKADMPVNKALNNNACAVDEMIYIIGGSSGANKDDGFLTTVEAYDPIKDIWVGKANMPIALSSYSSTVCDGKIYVSGGLDPNLAAVATLQVYDIATDTWTRKADMPFAREAACASTANGKIYVMGGDNAVGNDWGPALPEVFEYDPLIDIWTIKKSNMPTPRNGLAAVVVGNKIYTISGFNLGIASPVVEIYDPIEDNWTKGEDILIARCFPSCSIVNGKIYVIGGYSINNNIQLSDVEEYDTGFKPSQIIESKGKLSTTWGEKKK